MASRIALRSVARRAVVVLVLAANSACIQGGRDPSLSTPTSGSTAPPRGRPAAQARPNAPAPALDTLSQYNLDRINAYRRQKGVVSLAHDASIAAFARAGSERLSRDHAPHAHFVANTQRPPPGFGSRMAENQGDPSGVPVMDPDPIANGKKQIDVMLKLMFDEGPGGGHYDNMVNPLMRRVGIGLVYAGGRLYMTNDFSD